MHLQCQKKCAFIKVKNLYSGTALPNHKKPHTTSHSLRLSVTYLKYIPLSSNVAKPKSEVICRVKFKPMMRKKEMATMEPWLFTSVFMILMEMSEFNLDMWRGQEDLWDFLKKYFCFSLTLRSFFSHLFWLKTLRTLGESPIEDLFLNKRNGSTQNKKLFCFLNDSLPQQIIKIPVSTVHYIF